MWITETPWPPIAICLALAAALIAAWYSRGRGLFLVAAAVVLLFCPALWFIERAIVTDAEHVEAAVLGVTSAFQQGDVDETLSYFHPDEATLRLVVGGAIAQVEVHDDLRITDLIVKMQPGGKQALSHFRANGTVSGRNVGGPTHATTRWQLTWRKEGEDWRIIKIQRLDPLTGESIGMFEARAE